MELRVRLQGGDRVAVEVGPHTVVTDQDGSAPSPFALFLASIGACAGFYVARFCAQRGIAAEGIEIRQIQRVDEETKRVREIALEIDLPDTFPHRYRDAVLRAAATCTVKRHLEQPPRIALRLRAGVESVAPRG